MSYIYSNFTGAKNYRISLPSRDRPWAIDDFSYKTGGAGRGCGCGGPRFQDIGP